jgi:NADH:ubiquinone oxidoreductase subunit 5 (subunit L)/multisubunit Na+/H+ antiporter MnhA subunit
VSFLLDQLSAVMILVITGIGLLIHLYSVGYMQDDHNDPQVVCMRVTSAG